MTETTKNLFLAVGNPVYEIIDTEKIIQLALENGDALTSSEVQMLINIKGVSINSKPRRDGRFQGCVATCGGKKYFYGSSREEVAFKIKLFFKEDKKEEKEEKKKKEKYSPTFREFADKWLDVYKRPNLKPSSIANLVYTLEPAYKALGKKQMRNITADDVQELLLSIDAPTKRKICKINLGQIFKKALVQKIIRYNPCDAVEIKKHTSTHKKALTVDEQERFLQAAKASKHELLYRFLLSSGLRIGEALALTKADFGKDSVTVSKNVVYLKGKRIEQDTPKTQAGNRTVPINEELVQEILEHAQSELIFSCTYNAAKLGIEYLAKNTGIKVSLHILRHTYATRLEEKGVPPKVKQYLMGHASLQMTQDVYTDIQLKYVESLSDMIKSLF